MNCTMKSVFFRAAGLCLAALLVIPLMAGCGKKEAPAADVAAVTPAAAPAALDQLDNPVVAAPQPPRDPELVVVTVDGEKITAGEIDAEADKLMSRIGRRMPPERLAQLRDQISEQAQENLILRTLLLNEVEKAKVAVTEEETKTALEQFKTSLPEGMTLDDLMMQSGMSKEEFDKNLMLDMRVNKLLTEKTEGVIEPTDAEIQEYFAENKDRFEVPESVSAKHILIAVEAEDDEATKTAKKAKADEVRTKLLSGADFAAMATEYSDCPSKTRGGDLGTFSRGQMVKPFEDAAFSQPTNTIGEVVETQFGYHIIDVTEHKEPHTYALDEIKDKISQMLQSQKKQKAVQDYIESLREKSAIVFPDKKS